MVGSKSGKSQSKMVVYSGKSENKMDDNLGAPPILRIYVGVFNHWIGLVGKILTYPNWKPWFLQMFP